MKECTSNTDDYRRQFRLTVRRLFQRVQDGRQIVIQYEVLFRFGHSLGASELPMFSRVLQDEVTIAMGLYPHHEVSFQSVPRRCNMPFVGYFVT